MLDVLCLIFLLTTPRLPYCSRRCIDKFGRLHHSLLPLPPGPRIPSKCVCAFDDRRRFEKHVHHGSDTSTLFAALDRGGPAGSSEERSARAFQGTTALRKCQGREDSQNNVVHGCLRTSDVSGRILHLDFG